MASQLASSTVGMVNVALPVVDTFTVRVPRCCRLTTSPAAGATTCTFTSNGASGAGSTVTVKVASSPSVILPASAVIDTSGTRSTITDVGSASTGAPAASVVNRITGLAVDSCVAPWSW